MKFLLTAINAKYIHSNPGVYSLKVYAEHQGDLCLQKPGLPCVQVEIAEYTINNQMEQILEDVYKRKPDVIGISCYIWNVTYALDLVRDLHKVLPETDIWLGGPEVSFDAPKLLAKEPEIMGVMKGEGEETFAGLLKCYEELGSSYLQSAGVCATAWSSDTSDNDAEDSNTAECDTMDSDGAAEHGFAFSEKQIAFWKGLHALSGVTYRTPSGVVEDHAICPVMDMSRIPFLYPNLDGFEHRIVYYESSRGCPFSCSYCLSSIDKSVRFRDLELVKKELDFFLEKRVPQVKFVDRTFNCKKSHAMAIWQHIFEHDNGVTNFHFEIAADLLDEEELELIGKMRPGLIQLEIGVQSTNPDTITEIHRRMNLDELKGVVARINRGRNVHQHLDLIAGLPYEDYESFHRSFNEVYAMEPEQLQLGFLKVLKGSYMYENAARYDLQYRALPPYEVLSTKWLSYGDVLRLKGVENMVEVYYNSGQFTRTLARLVTEFGDAFVLFERLAQYYEKQELFGLNHSRLARYEILHRFIVEWNLREESQHGSGVERGSGVENVSSLGTQGGSLSEYEDALVCDLYLRENAKSRPSFALEQAAFKEEIRELLPELRKLGTQVHAEVLQSGEILLFDYRVKDPLTKNAQVTSLGFTKKE